MSDNVKTEVKEIDKKKKRNEIILIVVIAILALGVVGWKAYTKQKLVPETEEEETAYVIASIGNYDVLKVPLHKDGEYRVGTDMDYNIVVVKDAVVTVTEASCPDKLCTYQADITVPGEIIVCLPNMTIVTIEDANNENALDGVVQ